MSSDFQFRAELMVDDIIQPCLSNNIKALVNMDLPNPIFDLFKARLGVVELKSQHQMDYKNHIGFFTLLCDFGDNSTMMQFRKYMVKHAAVRAKTIALYRDSNSVYIPSVVGLPVNKENDLKFYKYLSSFKNPDFRSTFNA